MRFFSAALSIVLLFASPAFSANADAVPLQEGAIAASPPQKDPDVVQVVQVGGDQATPAPPIQEMTTPAPEILLVTAEPDILPVTAGQEDDATTTPAPGPSMLERLRERFNEIRKIFNDKGLWAATRYIIGLDAATKREMLRANPSLFDVEDLEIIKMVRGILPPQES